MDGADGDAVMADPTSLAEGTEDGENVRAIEIELDPAPEAGEPRESGEVAGEPRESDDPPEYTTILDEEAPEPLDDEAPPLSYEAALTTGLSDSQPKRTLTVEAPPSYVQLFGMEEADGAGPARSQRRERRHTIQRGRGRGRERERGEPWWKGILDRAPKDVKLALKYGLIAMLLLVGVALPISMIVVGFTNLNRCSIPIPLYLVVAGFILLVEVILHSLLCMGQKCSEDESFYKVIRRCDCLAVFLIAWLLVGSNWVFRGGMGNETCGSDTVDYVVVGNMTDDVEIMSGAHPTDGMETGESESDPAAGCSSDCSTGVYAFAVVLILIQYMALLILAVCCCSTKFRSRSSRRR